MAERPSFDEIMDWLRKEQGVVGSLLADAAEVRFGVVAEWISAERTKAVRAATSCSMVAAKTALRVTRGNQEQAIEHLLKSGYA